MSEMPCKLQEAEQIKNCYLPKPVNRALLAERGPPMEKNGPLNSKGKWIPIIWAPRRVILNFELCFPNIIDLADILGMAV